MRSLPAPYIVALLTTLAGSTLKAQAVVGVGDDATVPRPGTIRVGVSASISSFDRRYNRGGDGSLEPLGTDMSTDTLGVAQLPQYTTTQTTIRSLANTPAFVLSLGKITTQLAGRVERLPVTLELGVLPRFAIGATLPVVRTRVNSFITANLTAAAATVGLNPALTVGTAYDRDTSLVNALTRAGTQLQAKLAMCQGSTSSDCEAVNANRTAAQNLATESGLFATQLSQVYSNGRVVPVGGGAAQTAIELRVTSFKSSYAGFGVTELAGAPPGPAPAVPIAGEDIQTFVTDSLYGIRADPVGTVQRIDIGDAEFFAKLVLLNSAGEASRSARLGARFAVTGLLRLGTGSSDIPRNFLDIATGDGQTDIEGAGILDLIFGRRFSASVAARYTRQLADDITVRIPDYAGQPFLAAFRERTVHRDLGDVFQIAATPRFSPNDFFAIAGYYRTRRKGADSYEGTFTAPAVETGYGDVALDASVLETGTAYTAHEAGIGVAFSSVAAFARGHHRFPYELSFLHVETISGRGGSVPKTTEERIQLRVYTRIFWR